jgi:hypothetical protein
MGLEETPGERKGLVDELSESGVKKIRLYR